MLARDLFDKSRVWSRSFRRPTSVSVRRFFLRAPCFSGRCCDWGRTARHAHRGARCLTGSVGYCLSRAGYAAAIT